MQRLSGHYVFAILLMLSMASFQCLDDGSRVTVDAETEPLPFERVVQGQRSSFSDTTEIAVEDRSEWDAISRSFPEVPRTGVIDFDELMVLLAAIPAPSGGYDVHFRSVEIAGNRLIAHYAVGVPGDDCITTMGLTVPYEAISIRRVDLPVVFERSQEVIPCTFR